MSHITTNILTGSAISSNNIVYTGSAILSNNIVYTGIASSSNNIVYGSGGISRGYVSQDLEYKIGKYKFSINRYLNHDEINFITCIGIMGVEYYHGMIDNGFYLSSDLEKKIEPIIKLMNRKDVIDAISKKEKNE